MSLRMKRSNQAFCLDHRVYAFRLEYFERPLKINVGYFSFDDIVRVCGMEHKPSLFLGDALSISWQPVFQIPGVICNFPAFR